MIGNVSFSGRPHIQSGEISKLTARIHASNKATEELKGVIGESMLSEKKVAGALEIVSNTYQDVALKCLNQLKRIGRTRSPKK